MNLIRATLPLIIALQAVKPCLGETYDQTWRYGYLSIPRVEAPPAVDGVIDPAEWGQATLFPPMLEMEPGFRPGLPTRERTWIWMAYTADALYVAWRQDLPPEELPSIASVTDQRDACEARDNTVNILFSVKENLWEQFNISGNSASQLYDRRFDDGSGNYWNPDIAYKSRPIPSGWEGELKIPFREIGLPSEPAVGARWRCYFYSAWRKKGTRLLAWPYVRWRTAGETGQILFGGTGAAIRFEEKAAIRALDAGAELRTRLLYRKSRSKQSYCQHLATALQVSQVEGGTLQSFEKVVGDALAPFEPASEISAPGEYLLRYELLRSGQTLASGILPYYQSPPLELDITPLFLSAHKLLVEARTEIPNVENIEVTLSPGKLKAQARFAARRAALEFPTSALPEGDYELQAEARAANGEVLASAALQANRPAPPDWWTLKEGLEPLVPPPWTPVQATRREALVLGRRYQFAKQPVPAQITTRGQEILAAPMELQTSSPWKPRRLKLVEKKPDAAIYQSENRAEDCILKGITRVEFDGFMLVDLYLTGSGPLDKLDLVIPFKKEHAILLQNYARAGGPGSKVSRFTGLLPVEGYQSPPMITTWIGTDHYGLEWSCESSRGWSMAKPDKAIEVATEGDQVVVRIHFITRPVTLSEEKPRHIRFGLVATPTKTIPRYLQRCRPYDDIYPGLLPLDWAGYPAWHRPITDPALLEAKKAWVGSLRKTGAKFLVNGGWNVSTQSPDWDAWGKEMLAEPLQNVSFSNAKQFAACWNTPFAIFMANSFGHNARVLQFDGIRFDTVVPSYLCESLVHDCGWYDDQGTLWPTFSLFSQREVWKRLYRIFHGGRVNDGVIYTPKAGGPIMAVDSFTDIHEIGEGFYQHAKTLKEGYPPGMVRATMTGEAYGFRTQANLKAGPLFPNERIAALLVNGAEPRFHDYRHWKTGYEAHASPAVSVWDAWEWVDRWNAQFVGWWENQDFLSIRAGEQMVLAGLYLHKGKKALLTITNYEKDPLDDLEVKLHLSQLGFRGPVFAEDAVTLEPVGIDGEGRLKLDLFGQRFRLIKVSAELPRHRAEALGENLLTDAPAEVSENWDSQAIELQPGSVYVLSALVKIDKAIGEGGPNPNYMGMFAPVVSHYAFIGLDGAGVHGVHATHKIALCPIKGSEKILAYEETDEYRRSYLPQWWEKTPGWTQMFVLVGSGDKSVPGRFFVRITDAGQARLKDLSLRKWLGKIPF